MKLPRIFPAMVIRLSKEKDEEDNQAYLFSCQSHYTDADFSVHGGYREDLEEAIHALAEIAPQALLHMIEEEHGPQLVAFEIAKGIPDREKVYEQIVFNMEVERLKLDGLVSEHSSELN